MTTPALLDVRDLRIELTDFSPHRLLVRDVSLTVGAGESVGLVGESGSGKSLTMKACLRLLPRNTTTTGDVLFAGRSVLTMARKELLAYRSTAVSMIHQDPRAHTNPMWTVGDFLIEGVTSTGLMTKDEALVRAQALLADMGIKDAHRRLTQYPHQLSGGLLQRVMIAAALMNEPQLVFADEPTTALDVTVQSDVMAILTEQIQGRHLGLLFVTHDLDLAAAVTDTLVVMYAGTVVERGAADDVYDRPRHPYTHGLLASRPSTQEVRRLEPIPGRPASAYEVPTGCPFAARCAFATDECRATRQELRSIDGHEVACHRAEELGPLLTLAAS